MLENIISGFMEKVNETVENSGKEPEKKHDFSSIERKLRKITDEITVSILEMILNDYLNEPSFLKVLKESGGRSAMRFKVMWPNAFCSSGLNSCPADGIYS